jgi:CcmD family protein
VIVKNARALVLAALVLAASLPALAQPPQPPTPAQEGFVPLDQSPPDDVLPAAPLVIAAYAVAWVVILLYVWSVWRRLARVEQELAQVARRIDGGARR